MADLPINDNEPGNAPARPTRADMDRNLQEWEAEVRRRISRMVAETIDHNRTPNATALRRLGPDGRNAFQQALVRAMEKDIADKTTCSKAGQPAAFRLEQSSQPLLRSKANWANRRTPRSSHIVTGWMGGLLRAALTIAAGVALLHIAPTPNKLWPLIQALLKDLA